MTKDDIAEIKERLKTARIHSMEYGQEHYVEDVPMLLHHIDSLELPEDVRAALETWQTRLALKSICNEAGLEKHEAKELAALLALVLNR